MLPKELLASGEDAMKKTIEKTKHDFVFLVGDYNHNGSLDLYYFKTCFPEFMEDSILDDYSHLNKNLNQLLQLLVLSEFDKENFKII